MHLNEGIDTGDMLKTTVISLDEKETGGSLFDKLAIAGADLLVETLVELENMPIYLLWLLLLVVVGVI